MIDSTFWITLLVGIITCIVTTMRMSDSYKVAIGEGSNMIRPGTNIFGERKYDG